MSGGQCRRRRRGRKRKKNKIPFHLRLAQACQMPTIEEEVSKDDVDRIKAIKEKRRDLARQRNEKEYAVKFIKSEEKVLISTREGFKDDPALTYRNSSYKKVRIRRTTYKNPRDDQTRKLLKRRKLMRRLELLGKVSVVKQDKGRSRIVVRREDPRPRKGYLGDKRLHDNEMQMRAAAILKKMPRVGKMSDEQKQVCRTLVVFLIKCKVKRDILRSMFKMAGRLINLLVYLTTKLDRFEKKMTFFERMAIEDCIQKVVRVIKSGFEINELGLIRKEVLTIKLAAKMDRIKKNQLMFAKLRRAVKKKNKLKKKRRLQTRKFMLPFLKETDHKSRGKQRISHGFIVPQRTRRLSRKQHILKVLRAREIAKMKIRRKGYKKRALGISLICIGTLLVFIGFALFFSQHFKSFNRM